MLPVSSVSQALETPEGFDKWSDDCKKKFGELKKELEASLKAEKDLEDAKEEEKKCKKACEELDSTIAGLEEELAQLDEDLADVKQKRKDFKEELNEDLNSEYEAWLSSGNRSKSQQRAKKRELKKKFKAGVAEFEADIKAKKNRKKAAKGELSAVKKSVDPCKEKAASATQSVAELKAAFGKHRVDVDIENDISALEVDCGPKDPKAGDPAIPITPSPIPEWWKKGADSDKSEDSEGSEGEDSSFGGGDEVVYAPETDKYGRPGTLETGPLDEYRKKLGDEHWKKYGDGEGTFISFRPELNAMMWHQGCVEFVWVSGTQANYGNKHNSNPITKTVQDAARDVNNLFGDCCVRFQFYLKVVELAALGNINGGADGISKKGGKITAPDSDDIKAGYVAEIKKAQDHKECFGLLVVDNVLGTASGYAKLKGGAGITEMGTQHTHKNEVGRTAAHEIGHGLGGIKHIEKVKGKDVKHKHGELMWGEGCDDHPNREPGSYDTLTSLDCEKMRAATTITKEVCKADGDEEAQ